MFVQEKKILSVIKVVFSISKLSKQQLPVGWGYPHLTQETKEMLEITGLAPEFFAVLSDEETSRYVHKHSLPSLVAQSSKHSTGVNQKIISTSQHLPCDL